MPRIPEEVIYSVFYLYSPDDLMDPQATGFFVLYPELGSEMRHLYAVTNWHNIFGPDENPCPIIGYVDRGGTSHTIKLKQSDWRFQEGGIDAAVAPIDADISVTAVPSELFLTQEEGRGDSLVDVGDDVFMMGLFADHGGTPAARFGHISVIPSKRCLVPQPNAGDAEAYILDLHSRDGFSGSPAFVFRTFGSDLNFNPHEHFRLQDHEVFGPDLTIEYETVFKFLGLHYAQYPEDWEIGEKKSTESRRKLIPDKDCVKGFSGMTCVIPAWELLNLIKTQKELVAIRTEKERRERAKKKKPTPRPERKDSKNPLHKKDFNRLLGEAVKRPKSSDQT